MVASGFTGKESATIIGCHPSKASQAMQPAWDKVAMHFRVDPARTLFMLYQHASMLDPMTESEIELRVAMLRGTASSLTTHPNSTLAR